MTPEEELMVKKFTDQLGEHFEAVLILMSRREGDGTTSYSSKYGNACACKGMADDYILRDRARMKSWDDDEHWRRG